VNMSVSRISSLDRLRKRYLGDFASFVMKAVTVGQLTGKPTQVEACRAIAGPRSGAIELLLGLEAGKVREALAGNDCAKLRRYIPWDFSGEPQAYMTGRFLRLEAGWPDGLAETMIRLSDISHKPEGKSGGWVAGKSETGATIVPHLTDRTAHYLLAGSTGSGKSVALQCAILQLCEDPDNALVLIDGKLGESLRKLQRLPGVLGPCAVDPDQVRGAIGWAAAQMRYRYQGGSLDTRLIVVVDEIQELVRDQMFAGLMRKIAAQGRAARVHLLASTQHPTVESFGDSTTRRNLSGKVALRVEDPDASRVAVGGKTPRADHLLGSGDCYIVGPGTCHRVQGAFVDQADVDAALAKANGRAGRWLHPRWPEYCPEDVGQDIPTRESKGGGFQAEQWSRQEVAAAIIAALREESRRDLCKRASAMGTNVGSTRGRKLQRFGHEVLETLDELGYIVAPTNAATAIVSVG